MEHSLKDHILMYTKVHKSWTPLGRKNVYVLLLSDIDARFFFQNTTRVPNEKLMVFITNHGCYKQFFGTELAIQKAKHFQIKPVRDASSPCFGPTTTAMCDCPVWWPAAHHHMADVF